MPQGPDGKNDQSTTPVCTSLAEIQTPDRGTCNAPGGLRADLLTTFSEGACARHCRTSASVPNLGVSAEPPRQRRTSASVPNLGVSAEPLRQF
jgi:hypothetical protein